MQINTHYFKKTLHWLLPYICLLCGHPAGRARDLCQLCQQTLPLLKKGCEHCALPLPDTAAIAICGHCLQRAPSFNTTHALYLYQFPIARLILELKFRQALVNARILGELLTEQIEGIWYRTKPLPNIIIPVPLHPVRLKERGFNQALEIARPIAKALSLPIDTTTCQRTKYTQAQTLLSAAQRRQNLKQAFTVTGHFSQQHIAVIDDVITTGNTVTEFCDALKQAGAETIEVWCCARAAPV